MLLVSSGFTVLFRILKKQTHFFGVHSPESALQPSSEELIYRFMEMFEIEGIGRKFPEWELHPQNQGASSLLPGGEGGRKSQMHEGRVGCRCPAFCLWTMGFCTFRCLRAPGLCLGRAPKEKCRRQFIPRVLLLVVLRRLK